MHVSRSHNKLTDDTLNSSEADSDVIACFRPVLPQCTNARSSFSFSLHSGRCQMASSGTCHCYPGIISLWWKSEHSISPCKSKWWVIWCTFVFVYKILPRKEQFDCNIILRKVIKKKVWKKERKNHTTWSCETRGEITSWFTAPANLKAIWEKWTVVIFDHQKFCEKFHTKIVWILVSRLCFSVC